MGFVRMLVLDQEGTPVPNVNACASLTSNGFVCAFTRSDGVMEHPVPVGMRRTWSNLQKGTSKDPIRWSRWSRSLKTRLLRWSSGWCEHPEGELG